MAYGSAPYGSTTYGQQAVILPTIVGSMNQTLAKMTFTSATAADQLSGSLSKTLANLTGTLAIANAVAAALTKTLAKATITSGSGAIALAATLSKTFVDLIRTLQLQGSIDSALSKTLAFLGLSADGIAYARTGNLVALLADVLATAMQGAGAISGTLTKTLNTFLGSNLIQNSKFAGTTGLPYGWSAYASTPTITYGQTDPNGGTSAIAWDYKSGSLTGLIQSIPITARNQKISSGIWLRADAPTVVRFGVGDSGLLIGDAAVTTSWQFFSNLNKRASSTEGRLMEFFTDPSLNAGLADGSKVYVAFPQANFGTTLMAYEDSNSIGRAFVSLAGTLWEALTEAASVNLFLWAQDFDNAYWSAINAKNITPNTTIAPDGTLSADTITDNSSSVYQGFQANTTVPNDGRTRVPSIHVLKTSGGTSPTFGINASYNTGGTAVSVTGRFNTDTGAASGGVVEDAGAYWRVSVPITNNLSGNTNLSVSFYPATAANGIFIDSSAAMGSAVIWGAQLDTGNKISPYTPTTSSQISSIGHGLTFVTSSTVALVGTLSRTLSILLDTLAATAGVSGTLSKTLAALGRTITGGVSLAGTLNKALGKMVLTSGTVTGSIVGTLSKTLGKLTVASSWVKAARRRIMMMTRSRRPNGL